MADVVNVIPCMMPYVDAQFSRGQWPTGRRWCRRQHKLCDGEPVCRIPEDMVFTEEYSVRAARIAVYTLFDIPKRYVLSHPTTRPQKSC